MELVNISITFFNCGSFSGKTLEIYPLSYFETYDRLLLSISFYPAVHFKSFYLKLWLSGQEWVSHPASGNHHSNCCFYELSFTRFHMLVRSCGIFLSVPGLFYTAQCPPDLSTLPHVVGKVSLSLKAE